MGKSRGRSHKQARNNPTGLVALEPEEGEVLLNLPLKGGPQKLSHDTIKSLSKQLQSASVEDRDCVNILILLQPLSFIITLIFYSIRHVMLLWA